MINFHKNQSFRRHKRGTMRNDPGAYRRFIRAALYEKIVYWPCQIEFFSGTKEAQSISAEFTMKIRFWAFSARLV